MLINTYLDDAGNIKWPKADGFVLDDAGNPIMVDADLKAGQLIDRYGDAGGRFTSPLEDGTPLAYDTRGLPYPESAMDYHMSQIDQEALGALLEKYDLSLSDMANPQAGAISEVFGAGGGTQIQLAMGVEWYEKLGLLKEIN